MRRYASFFEWYDKGTKELGVAETLVGALAAAGEAGLHSAIEFTPDPPDCVCRDANGNLIAIEVAEVVCEHAARLVAHGRDVYRSWRPGELEARVARELSDKDSKVFHGGPYRQTICCLFTDEPALSPEEAANELAAATFGPFKQLTSAYLVFSYSPGDKTCPFIRLALR
jgi:hypothetical protein